MQNISAVAIHMARHINNPNVIYTANVKCKSDAVLQKKLSAKY